MTVISFDEAKEIIKDKNVNWKRVCSALPWAVWTGLFTGCTMFFISFIKVFVFFNNWYSVVKEGFTGASAFILFAVYLVGAYISLKLLFMFLDAGFDAIKQGTKVISEVMNKYGSNKK